MVADIIKGNRLAQQGMTLQFFPPVLKDGLKLVQVYQDKIEAQCEKWSTTLIWFKCSDSRSHRLSSISAAAAVVSPLSSRTSYFIFS
ncbi:hypothetical protein P3L10_001561 [Capsicum annuum]